jgi:hypothetical protein
MGTSSFLRPRNFSSVNPDSGFTTSIELEVKIDDLVMD